MALVVVELGELHGPVLPLATWLAVRLSFLFVFFFFLRETVSLLKGIYAELRRSNPSTPPPPTIP